MTTTFKLYELTEAMSNIAYLMEEGSEGLQEAMDTLEGAFEQKVEGILKLKRSKEATVELVKVEIERLQKIVSKHEKDAKWLNNYVECEMQRSNKTEVKGNLFTAKLQLTPPRVEVVNELAIPRSYLRVVPESAAPDKIRIKDALQNGQSVPGCELKQDLKLKVR